jgi:hypothetical protein
MRHEVDMQCPRIVYTDLNGLFCKAFKASTKVTFLLKGHGGKHGHDLLCLFGEFSRLA